MHIFTTCYGWSGLFASKCESSVWSDLCGLAVGSTASKCKQGTEERGGGQKEMVPNNNQCVHLAAVTKSCWHSPNTHVNVYTQKAKTQTHTHTHTETEWIMSTQQSRDFLLSHQFNVSIFVDLPEISLLVQKWATGVMNEVPAPLSALCARNETSVSCPSPNNQWFSYTSGSQSILRDQSQRDPRTGYVSITATLNFTYSKIKVKSFC